MTITFTPGQAAETQIALAAHITYLMGRIIDCDRNEDERSIQEIHQALIDAREAYILIQSLDETV